MPITACYITQSQIATNLTVASLVPCATSVCLFCKDILIDGAVQGPSRPQSRIQKLLRAKQQPRAERLAVPEKVGILSYEEKVQKLDADIKERVNFMLAAWGN